MSIALDRPKSSAIFSASTISWAPSKTSASRPQAIRAIVERQEDVRFDRSHFSAHGDFALQFETVYYVLSADFNRHRDIQQKILLEMHREFDARGIPFAYSTQRLLLERQRAVSDAGNATAPS